MKKIILTIMLIIIIVVFLMFFYKKEKNLYEILKNVDDNEFLINKYSILGSHLNLDACSDIKITNDLELILKNNKEEIKLDAQFNTKDGKTCFLVSTKNNNGINLDNLEIGSYLLLVKEIIDNENIKYYTLKNDTKYGSLEYYTITKNNKNNKIDLIPGSKDKNYLQINIVPTSLPSTVYDVTIDPGHGGRDTGASGKLNKTIYNESDLNLKISLLLKQELERLGLKVKLTRDKDEYVDSYGEYGRAVIPNMVKSKYSISIHLNSYFKNIYYGGVEVYTPNDIDLSFAQILSDNISEIVNYSKKQSDKISNGVYYTSFTESDIKESNQDMLDNDMTPYDIKVGAPYMFMIREVGGINTNAYVDGRNDYYGKNEYYNSNITAEPYLIELGYINYENDLNKIVNNKEEFAKAISDAFSTYLNI